MVWHDEFNEGTSLGNDWTHEVQGAGWVNNELQNYVNGSADGKRVTELVDGKLNINCFKGSDGKIYSGRVYAKVNKVLDIFFTNNISFYINQHFNKNC